MRTTASFCNWAGLYFSVFSFITTTAGCLEICPPSFGTLMDMNEEQTQWPRNSVSTIASSFSIPGSSIRADSRAASRASVFTADTVYSQQLSASHTLNFRTHSISQLQSPFPLHHNAQTQSQRRHDTDLDIQRLQLRGRPGPLADVQDDDPYTAAQRAVNCVVPTQPAAPASSTNNRRICPHLNCGVAFKSKSHEAQHKKEHNDYACPQCGVTVGKKSDRLTHFQESCKKLWSGSPAWKCLHPGCQHILRTEFRVKEHQKEDGHADSGTAEIQGLVRPRYTCSNDGKIYRSLQEFMHHFKNPNCALNNFSSHRKLHDHERIHTLLQEGQDNVNGQHHYIYAELLRFCHQSGLSLEAWKDVVNRHTATDAQEIASKLEWGLVPNDGSDLSRLGFVNLAEMVKFVMSPSLRQDDILGAPNSSIGATPQLLDHTTSDSIPSGNVLLAQESRNEVVRSRRNDMSDRNPADIYAAAHTMHMKETFPSQELHLRLGTSSSGFHINATKPLSAPDVLAGTVADVLQKNAVSARSSSRPDHTLSITKVADDLEWSREKQATFERDWCSTVTPADQGYWPQDFLNHHASSATSMTPFGSLPNASHEEAIAEDQGMSVPPTLGVKGPKSKRPISTNSAYHPEAAARNYTFRNMPIRQSPPQSQSDLRSDEHIKTSGSTQRTSDVSVSDYFQWVDYYRPSGNESVSQPPKQPLAVTVRQGVADPPPSQYFVPATAPTPVSTSPERPKTPRAKVRAIWQKFVTPSIRELDDLPKNESSAFGQRSSQSSQNSPTAGLSCTTCGKTGDPSCFSGHVDLQKTIKSRRTGGTFTFREGSFHVDAGDALDAQFLTPNALDAFNDYDTDDWMR